MDAIGNQGLRAREHAGRDLQQHQADVDHDADQSTDAPGAMTGIAEGVIAGVVALEVFYLGT
jgi:hypothetical protein